MADAVDLKHRLVRGRVFENGFIWLTTWTSGGSLNSLKGRKFVGLVSNYQTTRNTLLSNVSQFT